MIKYFCEVCGKETTDLPNYDNNHVSIDTKDKGGRIKIYLNIKKFKYGSYDNDPSTTIGREICKECILEALKGL
jgi:hypothetical protein